MRVLVVDDEPLARQRLVRFLETINPEYEVRQASDGEKAMAQVSEFEPELVLLDIRMPVMDGLEVAKRLAALDEPPAVVFCTAFEDHALDALRARAAAYLLKPVRLAELEAAIARAGQVNRLQVAGLMEDQEAPDTSRTHLSISSHRGIELVPLDAVLCFRAEQKYVAVVTREQQYLTDQSLKTLETDYAHLFIRVHRSTLAARKHMQKISRDRSGQAWLWLEGLEDPLMISRRHLADVRSWFRDG